LFCATTLLDQIGSDGMLEVTNKENETANCLQNCEHQFHIPTFTTSVFPIEQTFMKNTFFCLTLFKLAKICMDPHKAYIFEQSRNQAGIKCEDILEANNSIPLCSLNGQPKITDIKANTKVSDYVFKYAKKNLALLKIFIKDPFYSRVKRDEESTFIAFLGNTGGLLGLCMGLSIVSIFEIVFHFIHYAISKSYGLRQHFMYF